MVITNVHIVSDREREIRRGSKEEVNEAWKVFFFKKNSFFGRFPHKLSSAVI